MSSGAAGRDPAGTESRGYPGNPAGAESRGYPGDHAGAESRGYPGSPGTPFPGSSPGFRSALYTGHVLHDRLAPRRHRFRYRLFYLALDLDELPVLHRRHWLFSVNRPNVFAFHERDYLPTREPLFPFAESSPDRPPGAFASALKARVLAFCGQHGVVLPGDARVVLVTLPRIFGYQFNPVSFYFCTDPDGTPRAAIAEVTNTFREVKLFFVPPDPGSGRGVYRVRVTKQFYVSPFSTPDLAFDFTLREPQDHLGIRIDDYDGSTRVLHSALAGKRAALTDRRLAWYLVAHPLLTLRVITLIHWEALRLWLKRVPFWRKADRREQQRDLYRPHASLQPTPLS